MHHSESHQVSDSAAPSASVSTDGAQGTKLSFSWLHSGRFLVERLLESGECLSRSGTLS